ncbi:MAG: hypothetical protein FJY41_05485 [Betaproteobacteria bacterium]|nr:hypothetical protein [Betaproteobacteria bacterium]
MLKILVIFSIFFALVSQYFTSEVKANTNYDYLLHINDRFDKHPIHLNNYQYRGYWAEQGSLLKKAASTALPNSALCEKGNYGNLVVSVDPYVFYNPLMTTFYGTLTAKIYNQDGKPIKKIKVEDELIGRVNILYEIPIKKLYNKLLLELDKQIKNDSDINLQRDDITSQGIEGSFCQILD